MIDLRSVSFNVPDFAAKAAAATPGTALVIDHFIAHAIKQPIVQVAFTLWEGTTYAGEITDGTGLMICGVRQLLQRTPTGDAVFDAVAPTRILNVVPDTYYLGTGIAALEFGRPLLFSTLLFPPPGATKNIWDRITDIYGTLYYGPDTGDAEEQRTLPTALPSDSQDSWVPPQRSE